MKSSKRIEYMCSDPNQSWSQAFSSLAQAKAFARQYGYAQVHAQLIEETITNLATHNVKKAK